MSAEAFVRTDAAMCVAILTYVVELKDVDAQLPAHVAWLERNYAEGRILMSGRRNPRTGGVILFRGEKDEVEALTATDPFVLAGVARTDIIPFTASMAEAKLRGLLG